MENIRHVFTDMAKFRYATNWAGGTQDPIQTPQSTGREASIERGTVVKLVCNEGMYTRLAVADAVSERVTVRSWRNWQKQSRLRRFIWVAKVSSQSRVTPRSRTAEEKVLRGKVEDKAAMSKRASCWRMPSQMN